MIKIIILNRKYIMISIVRENLLNQKGYTPYCGNESCRTMPRTKFDGEQFICPDCGWRSEFPIKFIEELRKKWK